MIAFADWFPLLILGCTFTTFGFSKVYGFKHNIVGGGGKPWRDRFLGSCPTWSKYVNVSMTTFFLVFGLLCLSILGWLFLSSALH